MGFQTAMTRKDDTFVTLDNRAKIANELNPALFVSVHFNSAPAVKAEGVEVFYYRSEKDKGRSAASKTLAENILSRIIMNTDANSRGVKHGDLAVIRKTNMPAVLVEGGFLTNESEYQKLKDANYIKRMMWGIAQGIQKFTNAPSRSAML
jgi:N-acetylmuramoyl-L-alanine amidase